MTLLGGTTSVTRTGIVLERMMADKTIGKSLRSLAGNLDWKDVCQSISNWLSRSSLRYAPIIRFRIWNSDISHSYARSTAGQGVGWTIEAKLMWSEVHRSSCSASKRHSYRSRLCSRTRAEKTLLVRRPNCFAHHRRRSRIDCLLFLLWDCTFSDGRRRLYVR